MLDVALTTADDLTDNAAHIFTTAYSFTAVPNFDAAAHNFTAVPNFAAALTLTAVPTPNFNAVPTPNFTAVPSSNFTAVPAPNFLISLKSTVNENSPDIKNEVEDSTFTVFRKELCQLYHRVKIIGVQELTIVLCYATMMPMSDGICEYIP